MTPLEIISQHPQCSVQIDFMDGKPYCITINDESGKNIQSFDAWECSMEIARLIAALDASQKYLV